MLSFKISNTNNAYTLFQNNITEKKYVERFCNNGNNHFACRKWYLDKQSP